MIMLKISRRVQWSLFFLIGLSLSTGILFFALKTWFMIDGDFGIEKHPWQFPVLQLHAAGAFLIMLLFGAMLGSHVQLGWRSKRSRRSGLILGCVLSLQVISAYALYYLSNDWARMVLEYVHLGIGLSIPMALTLHVLVAKKRRVTAPL